MVTVRIAVCLNCMFIVNTSVYNVTLANIKDLNTLRSGNIDVQFRKYFSIALENSSQIKVHGCSESRVSFV